MRAMKPYEIRRCIKCNQYHHPEADCLSSSESQPQAASAPASGSADTPNHEADSASRSADESGLAALLVAVKVWRQAEKRAALVQLGFECGDVRITEDLAARALNCLRIVSDKAIAASAGPLRAASESAQQKALRRRGKMRDSRP